MISISTLKISGDVAVFVLTVCDKITVLTKRYCCLEIIFSAKIYTVVPEAHVSVLSYSVFVHNCSLTATEEQVLRMV
jgi:hypothetical protein